VALVAYSPLGNPSINEASALASDVANAIGARLGRTPAQILLRWSLQKGNVVIPKSVSPSRIVENAAVFDFALSADEMAALNGLPQRRLINPPMRENGVKAFDETATAAEEEAVRATALAKEWAKKQAAAAAAAASAAVIHADLR
jgi:diketogulonate reductase-like aldo/keto reductase